jgi:hypothetical protein
MITPSLLNTRRGWRHFACDECKHEWKEASRDCWSPSGENCPNCGEWNTPQDATPDLTLPCNEMGNLCSG